MVGQANTNKQQEWKKKLKKIYSDETSKVPKACLVRYTFLFLIPEASSAQKEKKKTTKTK